MSNGPFSGGEIDPEFSSGVKSGVDRVTGTPGLLRKLFEWYVGVVDGAVSGEKPPEDPVLQPDNDDSLAENAAESVRQWRSKDVPTTATGQGSMDVGRDEYGVDMPGGGTPRVAPSARPTAKEMPTAEPLPAAESSPRADAEWVASGGPNDRYSRIIDLVPELRGGTTQEFVKNLGRAWYQATGERRNFEDFGDAVQFLGRRENVQQLLMGM